MSLQSRLNVEAPAVFAKECPIAFVCFAEIPALKADYPRLFINSDPGVSRKFRVAICILSEAAIKAVTAYGFPCAWLSVIVESAMF